MGRAIRGALEARGDEVVAMVGRHDARPDPRALAPVDAAFEFSHATTLLTHVDLALEAGCRALVIGTTGWAAEPGTRADLERRLVTSSARAVVAPTFSLGAVLFAQLAEEAARLFGRFADY